MMPFSPEDYQRNQVYIRTLVESSRDIRPEWRKDIQYGRTQQGNIVAVEYTGKDTTAKKAIQQALTSHNQSIVTRISSSRPDKIFYIDKVVRPDQAKPDQSETELLSLGIKQLVYAAVDALPPTMRDSVTPINTGRYKEVKDNGETEIALEYSSANDAKEITEALNASTQYNNKCHQQGCLVIIPGTVNPAFLTKPKPTQEAAPATKYTPPEMEMVTQSNQQDFTQLIARTIKGDPEISFEDGLMTDNNVPSKRMVLTFKSKGDRDSAMFNIPLTWKAEFVDGEERVMHIFAVPAPSLKAAASSPIKPKIHDWTPPVLEKVTENNQHNFDALIRNHPTMKDHSEISFHSSLITDKVASPGMVIVFKTKEARNAAVANAPSDWVARGSESKSNVMYVFAADVSSLKAAAPAPARPNTRTGAAPRSDEIPRTPINPPFKPR